MTLSIKPNQDFVALGESNFGHKIQQSCLPIIAVKSDEDIFHVGSGVMIHQGGLLLTAGHVIEEVVRLISEGYEANILYVTKQKNSQSESYFGGLWPMRNLYYGNKNGGASDGEPRKYDLGLASLYSYKPDNEVVTFPLLGQMSFVQPKVGDRVFSFGYKMLDISFIEKNKVEIKNLMENAVFSSGLVEEVFPLSSNGRYKFLPGFSASMRSHGGRSGGFIINTAGDIIGIISTGMNILDNDTNPYYNCFGSLLWPITTFTVEVSDSYSESATIKKVLIYDALKEGKIRSTGLEKLELRKVGDLFQVFLNI